VIQQQHKREPPLAGGQEGADGRKTTITAGVLSAPIIPHPVKPTPLFAHLSEPSDPSPLGGAPTGDPARGRRRLPPAAPPIEVYRMRAALAGDGVALGQLVDQTIAQQEKHERAAAWHTEQAERAARIRARLEALIPIEGLEGGQ